MACCIGGICFSPWQVFVVLSLLVKYLWNLIQRHVLGKTTNVEARAEGAKLSDSPVTAVDSQATWNKLRAQALLENRVLVVDYHATWCVPCQRVASTVERLAKEFDGLFVKVDVDDDLQCGYTGTPLPTFSLYKVKDENLNLEQLEMTIGADPRKLQTALERRCGVW
ncbi:MAG: hypothetical protein KVP17_002642 [Porospora cf. gigantea B]|uniref:uncharacterized protein n=1 Tax=Porospora cf. gigantea B TaxID=2853592 RepID=UPI003571E801|nr:MAG: hypothetical protein KVP17_002642 [Porospora cf. gigantea B]